MVQFKQALLSGVVALALNSAAHAQETTSGGQSFEPAYFDQYAPRTALDMVVQIPGFQINFGDNRRGLGQGGANVLINGERISGKTDPQSRLARITAPSVVRIEVVDGASLDIPGLTGEVVNVFTKNTGASGTWEWSPRFRKELESVLWNGSVTVSGEVGTLSYSATLGVNTFRGGNRGIEERFTPDGVVFETRDEAAQFFGETPGLATSLTWKPKEDHIFNLNAEYNQFNFNGRETSQRTALTDRGDNNETLFSNAEDEWNAEIGGDYEFPAGPQSLNGKLKLIGFYRFEHSPTVSRFDTFDTTGQIGGSRFFRVADEAEAIGRAEYSWSRKAGHDWQLSAEGAFNFLDIQSSLLLLDISSGAFTDTPIDGATSRVEERRAETTLTHSRALSPKWDLQTSIGVEYSEISQTGVSGLTREFVRPKGFISATYKPDDSFKIRTRIERVVGQLNFFDFISSVDIQDNLDSTGNANLVPNQSWDAEIEFDKDFGQGNTLRVRFFGSSISDLVDRIPVGVSGDAVGNIDSAKRYGVSFNSTLKGERWNLNGMQLNTSFGLTNSAVDDPLTGISRRLNGDSKIRWRASFRHDIPNSQWAYGAGIGRNIRVESFRLNTINLNDQPKPGSSAFIEHKDILGLKVNLSLSNLLGNRDDFTRQVFTDRRDIGQLDFTEARSRSFGRTFRLSISGNF